MRSFGSDNHSGVHPAVLACMSKVNTDHVVAYGNDPFTADLNSQFKKHFGPDSDSYLVFNGTGANVMALQACLSSYQAVLCAESAHIAVDECGAVEKHTQSKLLCIPTPNGKLQVSDLERYLSVLGNQHHVQPRVISVANPTELGSLYRPEELKRLTDWAHQNHFLVHLDGARLSNAAAALNIGLKAISADLGVDILSFGGTKNGLMNAEAVVIFNPSLQKNFQYIRKQGMHLSSKMRFLAAQFLAYFENDLWLQNARHANAMAHKLAHGIESISRLRLARPQEANSVFAIWPREIIGKMLERHYFYVWNERENEVRLVCSFDTTENDVETFIRDLQKAAS